MARLADWPRVMVVIVIAKTQPNAELIEITIPNTTP
jgi:hypothetical protein